MQKLSPELHVLIGPAGAGKSTYVQQVLLKDPELSRQCVVVSSDAIRKELFGDENSQEDNSRVFQIVHERAEACVRNGYAVILDSTNVSKKSRQWIRELKTSVPELKVQAHVILATPEQIRINQEKRERKVPEDVVLRQLKAFSVPDEDFFTEPAVYHHLYYKEDFLKETVKRLDGIGQTSPWHIENAGIHTKMVKDAVYDMQLPERFVEVAKYHDIGKAYTRTVGDNHQVHFYGHPRVGAWLYLCGKTNGRMQLPEPILYVARMIEHHDDAFRFANNKEEEFGSPKGKKKQKTPEEKLIEKVGPALAKDLLLFEQADRAGAVRREDVRKLPLLAFMNRYLYWEEIVQEEPLHIRVSHDGRYVLLKYTQFSSDMSFPLCREARGSIFKSCQDGQYRYVCRPFDKFFNYGEPYAAEIDWKSACVQEKVDGSLMKLFYDGGRWRLATNGTIDAFQAMVSDTGTTFGEIFDKALGCPFERLGEFLKKDRTYLFELTSPETRVVISYGYGIYYLAQRKTRSGQEVSKVPDFGLLAEKIKIPKFYRLKSLKETIEAAKSLPETEEGFVVQDKDKNRIKVKSPEYLKAAHLLATKNISDKQIFEMIKEETIDDLLAYAPEQKERVQRIRDLIQNAVDVCEQEWMHYEPLAAGERKLFAEAIKDNPCRDFLFKKASRPELTVSEYLSRTLSTGSAIQLLEILQTYPKVVA